MWEEKWYHRINQVGGGDRGVGTGVIRLIMLLISRQEEAPVPTLPA